MLHWGAPVIQGWGIPYFCVHASTPMSKDLPREMIKLFSLLVGFSTFDPC
uniref:Uncharacterized protein n=2 Tax=Anguilla anguilla TaxID=7936 RepID=A0A0E9W340_ANGAN